MNQPPNVPPGYGAPQQPAGYGPPPSHPGFTPPPGPVPHSGSYAPPPQGHPQQAYAPPQSYPQPGYAPPQSYPQQGYQQPHGIRGMTRQMFNPASYRQQGSGSWAAASLIISLVSIVFCGLLSPLSLLFGLIGLVGKKRAKGLAFAGFLISLAQVGLWIWAISAGTHMQFQSEKLAAEAGAPVVAAIEEFKNDNKRVPHSLDELVAMGYLPETWNNGTDELSSFVKEDVQNKKWTDFLRYKPGGDAAWKGDTGFVTAISSDDPADWFDAMNIPHNAETKEHQTYGLAFIGIDNLWGTTDDEAVKQDGDKYDLAKLWGGDDTTRDAMKKKRELRTMMNQVQSKIKAADAALEQAKTSLDKHAAKLDEIIRKKNLRKDQVSKDTDAAAWLKLIGETNKRLLLTQQKRDKLNSTYNQLEVQMERLANQVELAKLADNKEELAKLQVLLDESKKAVEDDGYFGTGLSDDEAGNKWLDDYYND